MKISRRYCLRSLFALPISLSCALSRAGSYEDFFTAVRRDNSSAIMTLLLRGFDPNTLDPKGDYALLIALREDALKSVATLLSAPQTKVEVRNSVDESPLMLAALKGHLDIARQLIEKDADVNKPGWAPLHYAATKGHLAMMTLLLDNDAYIDAESPNGTTPLMMAAHYGSTDAVKLLLESGADPTLKNQLGLSAIDFANKVNRNEAAELIAAAVRAKQPKGSW